MPEKSPPLNDPITGERIISGTKGKTSTLRCKMDESAEDCANRHIENGWDVPPGYKLGTDAVGPILIWSK